MLRSIPSSLFLSFCVRNSGHARLGCIHVVHSTRWELGFCMMRMVKVGKRRPQFWADFLFVLKLWDFWSGLCVASDFVTWATWMAIFPDPKWSEQRMNNFWWAFWFAATWDFWSTEKHPERWWNLRKRGLVPDGVQMGATQRGPNNEGTILGGVRSTPRWATSRLFYMEL